MGFYMKELISRVALITKIKELLRNEQGSKLKYSIFLQCDWSVKKTFKSDWLFCFTDSFSLAEKKMRFGNKSHC